MNSRKNDDNKMNIIGVYAMTLAVIVCVFTSTINDLNSATNDLTQIQYLNANSQRAIRMVLMDKPDNQLLYLIGKETYTKLDINLDGHLSVLDSNKFNYYSSDVIKNWKIIEEIIASENIDYEVLEFTLDSHFDSLTSLSNAVSVYVGDINRTVLYLQFIGFGVMLAIGGMTLSNFLHAKTSAKQQAELSKLASIDSGTGLFNRSKCQELFKSPIKVVKNSLTAIIVIDLNDLKKINDSLGHRVGDELISEFAHILKEACDVLAYKPFVGRYGGDEFIIYYNSVNSQKDIASYLKELNFLVSQFNKDAKKFQLSYAVGYQLNNSENKLSVRELFDLADEKMYDNKKAMKLDIKNAEFTAYADLNNTMAQVREVNNVSSKTVSGKECSVNE